MNRKPIPLRKFSTKMHTSVCMCVQKNANCVGGFANHFTLNKGASYKLQHKALSYENVVNYNVDVLPS